MITKNLEEGYALAVKLSHMAIKLTQSDAAANDFWRGEA